MKSKTPALDHFAEDLTAEAWRRYVGRHPRVYIPREVEMQQLIKVLSRRSHNNPLLLGRFGVGKRAAIQALAEMIAWGDVPARFGATRILRLDLHKIVAGTKYRGQLEERIKAVHNEAEQSPGVILALSDLQMVLGQSYEAEALFTGLQASSATNSVQWISTATPEAYQNFQRLHPLHARFFNVIHFEPTSPAETLSILHKSKHVFEAHYLCEVSHSALESSVALAMLYLPAQATPGSAFEILDEAGAVVTLRESYNHGDRSAITAMEERYAALMRQLEKAVEEENFKLADFQRHQAEELSSEIASLKERFWEETYQENKRLGISIDEETVIEAVSSMTGIAQEKIRERTGVPTSAAMMKERREGVPEFERLQTRSILHGDSVSIRSGLAFVLLPHTPEFRAIFDNIIRPAAEANGLQAMKAEDIYNPGSILAQVWEAIRTAEIIIADISGKNPNVIYELGLCYGIQRCPILLVRDPAELPFNLRSLRYIQYDDTIAGTAELKTKLTAAIQEFLAAVRSS